MSLSKQHFDLVAKEIRRAKEDGAIDAHSAEIMALRFAETFQLHNQNFHRWRFLVACGVHHEESKS